MLFAALSALCKESFILALPALVVFQFYKYPLFPWAVLLQRARALTGYILVLAGICISLLSVIVLFIGTNTLGYAGVEMDSAVVSNFFRLKAEYNIKGVLIHILLIVLNPSTYMSGFYAPLMVLSAFLLLSRFPYTHWKNYLKQVANADGIVVLLLVVIYIPQFILYVKSGMGMRYYLPASLGFSVFIAHALQALSSQQTYRIKSLLLNSCVIMLIGWLMVFNLNSAIIFRQEARNTQKLLDTLAAKHTPNTLMFVISEPCMHYEWNWSFYNYMTKTHSIDNIVYHFIFPGVYEDSYCNNLIRGITAYSNTHTDDIPETRVYEATHIVVFPKMEKVFLERFPDIETAYKKEQIGLVTLYEK